MAKFTDVFIDVTKHGRKLPTSEYKESGANPIIDQGQSEIAGFTDEKEGLFENVPAIIFGDHTRVIKYIDKPFFLGADGVKILKAKDINANYKFLFYVLSSARIPNTGYNRHFKWLKEVEIPECSREDETYIVTVFDKIESLINDRKQQLLKLDELVKSRFIEMFGKISNKKKLEDFSILITKGASPKWQGVDYCDEGVLFITSENVREGYIDYSKQKFLPDTINQIQPRSKLQRNDILINIVNASIGRAALFDSDISANINQAVALVRVNPEIVNLKFLLTYLNSDDARRAYDSMKVGGDKSNLSLKNVSELLIPDVDIELQNEFATFVEQTDKLKLEIKESLDKLETLKKSLMQKYFG